MYGLGDDAQQFGADDDNVAEPLILNQKLGQHPSPQFLYYVIHLCKIMSNRRRLREKELVNQDIEDIFEEFYHLQYLIGRKTEQDDINYDIIRLVTILEQFFRFVVECGLEKDPDKTPTVIEMNPRMIDSVNEGLAYIPEKYIRNYVVSLSYSFQNQQEIISMMDSFGMLNKQNNIREMIGDLEDLFQLRHKVVHTVERQSVSLEQVKQHHECAEALMHKILDELKPPEISFYYQKTNALSNFGLREDRKKNFEAGKRYREEAIVYGRKAVEYLEERIRGDAHDADAYSQLLELYIGFVDLPNAQKCCKAILDIDSDEPWANYYMGLTLRKENPIKAIERFKKVIKKEPDTLEFHVQLIGMLTSQGQYIECLSCIDEAIEHLPHEPFFHMAKGTTFRFLNMPKCAEMYYKNADKHAIDYVRTFPEDVGGHKDILNDLQEFGRDDAIAECRRIMDEYWKKQ